MTLFEEFKETMEKEIANNAIYSSINFEDAVGVTIECLCKAIEEKNEQTLNYTHSLINRKISTIHEIMALKNTKEPTIDPEKEKHHKRFNGTIEPLTFSHKNDNEIYDIIRGNGHTHDCTISSMIRLTSCICPHSALDSKKEKPKIDPEKEHKTKEIYNKVCPEDKFNDLILKGHSYDCALKQTYYGHECIGEKLKPINKAEAMKPSGDVGFKKWLEEKEKPSPDDIFILTINGEQIILNSSMTINEINKIVNDKLLPGYLFNVSLNVIKDEQFG